MNNLIIFLSIIVDAIIVLVSFKKSKNDFSRDEMELQKTLHKFKTHYQNNNNSLKCETVLKLLKNTPLHFKMAWRKAKTTLIYLSIISISYNLFIFYFDFDFDRFINKTIITVLLISVLLPVTKSSVRNFSIIDDLIPIIFSIIGIPLLSMLLLGIILSILPISNIIIMRAFCHVISQLIILFKIKELLIDNILNTSINKIRIELY